MNPAFPSIVYLLCFATCLLCALLLARAYWRSRARLLFWSALCFVLLAANSLCVILDLLLLPDRDLSLLRVALSTGAVGVLLFGFVWDLEEEGR
jgi:hypothetical protein